MERSVLEGDEKKRANDGSQIPFIDVSKTEQNESIKHLLKTRKTQRIVYELRLGLQLASRSFVLIGQQNVRYIFLVARPKCTVFVNILAPSGTFSNILASVAKLLKNPGKTSV